MLSVRVSFSAISLLPRELERAIKTIAYNVTLAMLHSRSPEESRNSPVGERHALEEFIQGRLDAELLGGAPVVQEAAARESVVGESRYHRDREPGGRRLLLVRHGHSELVLVVLRLGLEVRHHKVTRVYHLARIPAAVTLSLTIADDAVKATLAR